MAVTTVLGMTAPDGSVIRPRMLPVVSCAINNDVALKQSTTPIASARHRRPPKLLSVIATSLLIRPSCRVSTTSTDIPGGKQHRCPATIRRGRQNGFHSGDKSDGFGRSACTALSTYQDDGVSFLQVA